MEVKRNLTLKYSIAGFGLLLIVIGTAGIDILTLTGCSIIICVIFMDK
jgi:hypothetical protein